MEHKLIVKNGTMLDGSGSAGEMVDLLISQEKIQHIGDCSGISADLTIDAQGLTVAPGFIDTHTHAEFNIAAPNSGEYMEPYIRQGVTTMVTGNCGVSAAPVTQATAAFLKGYWDSLMPEEGLAWDWQTMGNFLGRFSGSKPIVNMAQLVGHGTVRLNVMGCSSCRADADQIRQMRSMINQSMEQGAFGLSFGLGYVPGLFADTSELLEVGRDLARHNGIMTVHMRNHASLLLKSVAEVIAVAEALQIPLQISHFAPYREEYIEDFFKAHELVEEAKTRGSLVGFDMLSPPVSSTTACQLFPSLLFEDGFQGFLDKLGDAKTCSYLREETEKTIQWPPWEANTFTEDMYSLGQGAKEPVWLWYRLNGFRRPENLRFEFRTVAEIAAELDMDVYQALCSLMLAENGRLFFTSTGTDDDELEATAAMLYQIPGYSFMTDTVGIGKGARATSRYSTFPRLLGRHVNQLKTFTLEEAVSRCTSLAAAQIGLAGRGMIKPGNWADITIFDPEKLMDQATFERPFQFAEGVTTVIINGKPVFYDGVYLPSGPAGTVLRK